MGKTTLVRLTNLEYVALCQHFGWGEGIDKKVLNKHVVDMIDLYLGKLISSGVDLPTANDLIGVAKLAYLMDKMKEQESLETYLPTVNEGVKMQATTREYYFPPESITLGVELLTEFSLLNGGLLQVSTNNTYRVIVYMQYYLLNYWRQLNTNKNKQIMLSLTNNQREFLDTLGSGNMSAGFRELLKTHFKHFIVSEWDLYMKEPSIMASIPVLDADGKPLLYRNGPLAGNPVTESITVAPLDQFRRYLLEEIPKLNKHDLQTVQLPAEVASLCDYLVYAMNIPNNQLFIRLWYRVMMMTSL